MDSPEDTPKRGQEALLMAALDTIWRECETAMSRIQDDSRISGPADKTAILRSVYLIEQKAKEIRDILMISGEYSSVRKNIP